MAMGSKYLGPADNFIVGDKVYKPGQVVPLSKEEREHHALHGHRFADVNPTGDLSEGSPVDSEPMARDGRGAAGAEGSKAQ
jgi:hypothetical protein